MEAKDFFLNPKSTSQKQYEALRSYYIDFYFGLQNYHIINMLEI